MTKLKQSTIQCRSNNRLLSEINEVFHTSKLRLHDNHFGPKVFTNLQRIALLILWHRSEKNASRFLLELRETRWPEWLGLREFPSRASLYAWRAAVPLATIRELNTALLTKKKPTTMAIDGTGLDATYQSKHYQDRLRLAPLKGPKLDVLVDIDTLLVHDWSLLIKPRHDTYVAKRVLKRMSHSDILILADKGYDSEELYKICSDNNNRFFAPIKNAPYSDKPPQRLGWHKRKSHYVQTDYHRRSIVESVIRSIKSRVRVLRARLYYMKKREFAWHILARNLELQISFLLRHLEVLVRFAHRA